MEQVTCHSCSQEYKTQLDYENYSTRHLVDSEGNFWFRCQCETSLQLEADIPGWYSPVSNLSSRSALLYEKIKHSYAIPRLPTAIMRLNQQLADPNTNAEAITKTLKLDPAIAANIFRLANTYKRSRTPPITNLEHAINFVGREAVQELTIMAAIEAFDQHCDGFDCGRFWQESIIVGRIGEYLAEKYSPKLPKDIVYLAASLANVGKVLMAVTSPRSTAQLMAQQASRSERANWSKIESDLQSEVDHKRMGEIASALWGLPGFMQEICLEHHNLNKVMVNQEDDPDVLDLASVSIQIGHLVLGRAHHVEENIVKRFAKRFELDQAAMQRLVSTLHNLFVTHNH